MIIISEAPSQRLVHFNGRNFEISQLKESQNLKHWFEEHRNATSVFDSALQGSKRTCCATFWRRHSKVLFKTSRFYLESTSRRKTLTFL